MKTLVPATAFAAVLLLVCAPAAMAQDDAVFRATTLNLSADGEVQATPDVAFITLGVQTEARSAAEAMAQDAARMTRIVAALKGAGVADKEIQTSDISLEAQYDNQANQPARLRGYQAANTVNIRVTDVARLGPVVDAVTDAGANQVNGIRFALKDSTAAENEARLKAVKALQAKADLYAGAVGYRVARLVNLSEGSAEMQPIGRGNAMVFAGYRKTPVPVEAGELTVRMSVSGRYELTR